MALEDWGFDLQRRVEEKLACLWDQAEGEVEECPHGGAHEAAAPYCGCSTCEVRETLVVAHEVITDRVFETIAQIYHNEMFRNDTPEELLTHVTARLAKELL